MTQSVELLLDDELDTQIRRAWAVLLAAGLPSQGRHPAPTNRPHVTLTVAGSVLPYLETALKAELTGRLPVPFRLSGLLVFGERGERGGRGGRGELGGRHVLARAVVPNTELLELQASCAALFDRLPGISPLLQPGSWTPHITLARNLAPEAVGTAIALLGDLPEVSSGAAVAVRRWDSEQQTAWRVG